MEDWDSEYTDTSNKVTTDYVRDYHNASKVETSNVGRTFGGRGRGFLSKQSNQNVGRKFHDSFNHRTDNFNGREKNNGSIEQNDWSYTKDFKNNDFNKEMAQKPRSTYIPEAPSDNEHDIFGNGISSGINFKNYENIKVKVSGENVPQSIQSFHQAGLVHELLDVIQKCNYTTPTPVQKYSIPILMNGRDLMACAQTGSGKTAAFLIPIVNNLMDEKLELNYGELIARPQVLILSPTRELSIQIFNEARKFSYGTPIKIVLVYGGTAVYHQIDSVKKGCHILVATPGRLLDFVGRKVLDFSQIRYLVLDEADRMLNMGFLPEMKKIMSHPSMPTERQTAMFSATFPEEVQQLATSFLSDYVFLAVGIVGGACSDVEQKIFSVDKFDKRNKLIELLSERKSSRVLVFVELKRMADFIATFLCEKDFPATSIHGDREQREREMALKDFKTGKMNILVATSVAARGLDIKGVSHVLNFDLPSSIDEYVHRIGRTGRVGNRGLATSFFDPNRDGHLAPALVKILSEAGQEVPDFLREFDGGGVSYEITTDFGGSDCRNNWKSSVQVETFEDEQW